MKKITLSLLTTFICYSFSAYATENLMKDANQYYNDMVSEIVQVRYLPVEKTEIQNMVIQNILNSNYTNELKEKTWPCLSKTPELIDNKMGTSDPIKFMQLQAKFQKCFSPVMGGLMEKVSIATAEAKTGEKIDESNPAEKIKAISVGSKIISNNAATMHYANSLSNSISVLSIMAISANGGMGQDISASDTKELGNDKIACGASLFGKKDGSVLVNFQEDCIRMEKSDEDFDISVDNVIRGIQKGNEERAIFTCEGYKCIWKRK